ncbi:TpHN family protein [Theileria parva strain Muguga]|uniref:Tash1 protein, putative n=1 Tax=Theileria parva TaxID=5875 RepID=Q4N853_THEPA|nr:uncharacterized protein TpMuguga_01g00617 [Theileria parva strain Muguga]EAN33855.1 TpHN family protein [Theileria parva strain Muguga]|eukprot:XP_766138.1 hypothetical protein [Theileria parva strain Muguga]
MVSLINVCLIFVVIVYCTSFVSSLTLDLNNLFNSEFNTLKIVENGIIKTTIFSTADRPITKIRKGSKVIWQALSGESAKSITHISSKWSKSMVMTIEVDNHVNDDMYYICKTRSDYKYVTKEIFDEEFVELYKTFISMNERYSKRSHKRKKPKDDTDNTQIPKKRGKPRKIPAEPPGQTELEQQQPPENQQLEPDTIRVEMGTDDEDESTDTASEDLNEEQRKHLIMERINFVVSSDGDSDMDIDEPTNPQIIQSDAITQTEPPNEQSEIQTEHVLESEIVDKELIPNKHLNKGSLEFSDDELESEIIQVNLGLDTDDEEPLIITTHIPTNKPAQPQPQPQPQPQQLEPEVVQVAVESEDDEECSEVQQLQPSIDNSMLLSEAVFNQEVENLLETDFDDMGLSKTELDSLFYKTTDESSPEDGDES